MLFFALLSHLPIAKHPLSADDFLWNSHIQGSEQLYSLGLTIEDPNKSFWEGLRDGFLFYSDQDSSLTNQRNYGNMVWWGATEGQLVPFRPLSSALLWLDFQLFDYSEISRQWLSRVYFLIFSLCAFLFYWKLERDEPSKKSLKPNLALVLLSSLFLIFDLSVTHNFFWLAARNSYISLTFALAALLFHMEARDKQDLPCLLIALFLFTLALLSAEAAISMFGYLIAYAWFKDKRGIITGIVWVLPYLLVILVWRLLYNQLGFGAINNGLYTDPGHNLFQFCLHLLSIVPQIFSSLFNGIDGSVQSAIIEFRAIVIILSIIFSALVIYVLRDIIRKNSTTKFLFTGAILSIIPHSALIGVSSRSSTFAAVGLFYILALGVYSLFTYQDTKIKRYTARVSAFLILNYHLILPAIFCTLLFGGGVHFSEKGNGNYGNLGKYLQKNSNLSLLMINPPAPDELLYAPFEWDQSGRILPRKIQALSPGLSNFTLKRISGNELLLEAEEYFILNQNTPMKKPDDALSWFFHKSHIYRFNQSIISHPNQIYSVGQIINSAEMDIEIVSVINNQVSTYKITFTGEDTLEEKIWQEFDWASHSYKIISCPKVGDKLFFKGPF